jgi:preprotein translocase subunit SecG
LTAAKALLLVLMLLLLMLLLMLMLLLKSRRNDVTFPPKTGRSRTGANPENFLQVVTCQTLKNRSAQ